MSKLRIDRFARASIALAFLFLASCSCQPEPSTSQTATPLPAVAAQPAPTAREIREALLAELETVSLKNCTLKRYGGADDGGYSMCDNLASGVQFGVLVRDRERGQLGM